MSVTCNECSVVIPTRPKTPFSFFREGGVLVMATDYSAVYEHMRDAHPESWTVALAAEFEEYVHA